MRYIVITTVYKIPNNKDNDHKIKKLKLKISSENFFF